MSMTGYTKLFNSILASTIWDEPHHVRVVWITLLAMADRNGVAEGSIPGLVQFARVTRKECNDALQRLSAPDEDSRSKEYEGRRIEAVDGGWQIINHAKYRAKLSADERREYNRVKQAESRQKKSAKVKNVNDKSGKSGLSALSAHTEAEAEADTKAESEPFSKESAPNARKQSAGALAGSLPRDHIDHGFCGTRFCVKARVFMDFVRAYGTSADAEAKVTEWLRVTNDALGPDESFPGQLWLQEHWRAYLVALGRVSIQKPSGRPSISDTVAAARRLARERGL